MPPRLAPPLRKKSAVRSPRERLLDAAAELFCREGINAVGIEAVLAKAGTAKSTLYKTFGSKEALVDAVLDREGRDWRDWFIGALDDGNASARGRLDRIVPLLAEWFSSGRFYGCPFINAVGEHDKTDDRMRRQALAHKRVVLARIKALLDEAGAADADGLAHQVGLIIDGAIVAALVTRDKAVGDAAGKVLACLFDANLKDAPRIVQERAPTARGVVLKVTNKRKRPTAQAIGA